MSSAPEFGCPWCSHESDDPTAFRTHLLVDHRKSEVVDYVVEVCSAAEDATDSFEPLAH